MLASVTQARPLLPDKDQVQDFTYIKTKTINIGSQGALRPRSRHRKQTSACCSLYLPLRRERRRFRLVSASTRSSAWRRGRRRRLRCRLWTGGVRDRSSCLGCESGYIIYINKNARQSVGWLLSRTYTLRHQLVSSVSTDFIVDACNSGSKIFARRPFGMRCNVRRKVKMAFSPTVGCHSSSSSFVHHTVSCSYNSRTV